MRRKKQTETIARATGYDYSTREARERTASELFMKARTCRAPAEREWETYNDYYNFLHDAAKEMQEGYEDKGLEFTPACVPDPYIMVETQIQTEVPQPEFHGRDDDKDSEKAKMREYAVRFVCENNRLGDMNTSNERRCVKLGDAFWKVYWDPTMRAGVDEGDIRIEDVPVEAIYVDPSCRERGIQAGQFVDHIYRMHKVAFCIRYADEIRKLGLDPEDIMASDNGDALKIFDFTSGVNDDEDTVVVLEHWFKHPIDTKEAKAGQIGCSIIVGGHEVHYIPNYWENTGRQNQLFPFVHYWRIRDENGFYNKSELFAIIDLVDTADRILGMGIANQALMSNDVILTEENAFAKGSEPVNEPGAVWELKQGKLNAVRRLGGIQPMTDMQASVGWVLEQMQRANRNYETNQGKEAARITTATALSMMRSDAQAQDAIKTADRNRGFERLYELIDWSVLEFYDTDRLIWIGAKRKDEKPVSFHFNSSNFAMKTDEVRDAETDEVVREAWTYYPRVDVTVTAGDGIVRGKQATLRTLEGLTQAKIDATNWRIFAAQLELLDIPQKKEIIEDWKQRFAPPQAQKQKTPVTPTAPLPEIPPDVPPELMGMMGGEVSAPVETEDLAYEM